MENREMSVIKAGYRVTVTSWENDADSYSTRTIGGLDENKVRFHVDLLKLIAGSNCNDSTVFGNMYEPSDKETEAFEKAVIEVLEKHAIPNEGFGALDIAIDTIYEYTGYSEFYTRVVDSIVVEYVPQEIIIEDVSTKFGV
jgi:hypothetical protein